MRRLFLIVFTTLLVACNASGFAATPEEALHNLDAKENSFTITNILESVGGNQKGGFFVFEGEVENKKEWFVANVVSNDLYWYVKDYVCVGTPTSESESETVIRSKSFIAGWSNNEEDRKHYRFIVNIPNNDYFIWIEQL